MNYYKQDSLDNIFKKVYVLICYIIFLLLCYKYLFLIIL